MNSLKALAIVLATTVTTSVMASESTFEVIDKSGAWETNLVYDDDLPVACISVNEYKDQHTSRQHSLLKSFTYLPAQLFTMALGKDNWNIPDGLKTKVKFNFSNKTSYVLEAVGVGGFLEVDFYGNAINVEQYLEDFAASAKVVVHFEGQERPWHVKLEGSRKAANALGRCTEFLAVDYPFADPTQPYAQTDVMKDKPHMFSQSLEDQKAFGENSVAPLKWK